MNGLKRWKRFSCGDRCFEKFLGSKNVTDIFKIHSNTECAGAYLGNNYIFKIKYFKTLILTAQ
jgi:hypothetical protein